MSHQIFCWLLDNFYSEASDICCWSLSSVFKVCLHNLWWDFIVFGCWVMRLHIQIVKAFYIIVSLENFCSERWLRQIRADLFERFFSLVQSLDIFRVGICSNFLYTLNKLVRVQNCCLTFCYHQNIRIVVKPNLFQQSPPFLWWQIYVFWWTIFIQ